MGSLLAFDRWLSSQRDDYTHAFLGRDMLTQMFRYQLSRENKDAAPEERLSIDRFQDDAECVPCPCII